MVSIYAGTRGYLDGIAADDVSRFEAALLENMRANAADVLDGIRTAKDLTPEIEEKLKAFLDRFAKSFS